MPAFDPAAFWVAQKAAGMLKVATVDGNGMSGDIDVRLLPPDRLLPNLSVSREYGMRYQHADREDMAEGYDVTIDGVDYRVRSKPQIPDRNSIADAHFRVVQLTKQ